MRKSRAVPIATLSALAVAFSACGEQETAYCVDEDNRVVDNANCDRAYGATGYVPYFWLFGPGLRGRTPAPGERLPAPRTGDLVPANDRATLQSRGGFGAGARGRSGIGRTYSVGG